MMPALATAREPSRRSLHDEPHSLLTRQASSQRGRRLRGLLSAVLLAIGLLLLATVAVVATHTIGFRWRGTEYAAFLIRDARLHPPTRYLPIVMGSGEVISVRDEVLMPPYLDPAMDPRHGDEDWFEAIAQTYRVGMWDYVVEEIVHCGPAIVATPIRTTRRPQQRALRR